MYLNGFSCHGESEIFIWNITLNTSNTLSKGNTKYYGGLTNPDWRLLIQDLIFLLWGRRKDKIHFLLWKNRAVPLCNTSGSSESTEVYPCCYCWALWSQSVHNSIHNSIQCTVTNTHLGKNSWGGNFVVEKQPFTVLGGSTENRH